MTAKEILRQILDDGIMTEEKAIALINEYTLSVIELAIQDEIKEWGNTFEKPFNHLLTRVKTQIGE